MIDPIGKKSDHLSRSLIRKVLAEESSNISKIYVQHRQFFGGLASVPGSSKKTRTSLHATYRIHIGA